jgi:hypothetical protein
MNLDAGLKQNIIISTIDIRKTVLDTSYSEPTCYVVYKSLSQYPEYAFVMKFEIPGSYFFASVDPYFKQNIILDSKQNIILGANLSREIKIIRKVENYELEIPLMLTVSYRDNLIFVENEFLNLWGEGDSIEEAIKSFENFFLYDFKSYMDTPPNRMDLFAQEKLKYYKYLLKIT